MYCRWRYGLAVLPAVRSDPAGAREAGDEEPLRPQDDPRLRGVYASTHHSGGIFSKSTILNTLDNSTFSIQNRLMFSLVLKTARNVIL